MKTKNIKYPCPKNKFLYIVIAVLAFTLINKSGIAQSINSCNNYIIGNNSEYLKVSNPQTVSTNGTLNPLGSNAIWDMNTSGVMFQATINHQIVPASTVNGFNNFPQSNIVKKVTNKINEFLIQDSNGISLIGRYPAGIPNIEKYSNHKSLVNYPINFNDCNTDTYVIDSVYDSNFLEWMYATGKTQTCFDAIGEIHFSSNIVSCYRVTITDTTNTYVGSNAGFLYKFNQYWYDSNCNKPSPIMFANGVLNSGGVKVYEDIYALKDIVLNIENKTTNNNFLIFPNPTNDILNINYTLSTNNKIQIQIINSIGQTIKEISTQQPIGTHTTTVDTKQFANGIYFIRFLDGINTKQAKVIIQ